MNRHAGDEELERYGAGSLAEPECGEMEEHLLICHACQDRLTDLENYAEAMRAACGVAPAPEPPWKRLPRLFFTQRPVWAIAFAAACVIVVARTDWRPAAGVPGQPYAVSLEASRGGAENRAPYGRPLVLRIVTTQLPAADSWKLEIVNEAGAILWASPARPSGGSIRMPVPGKLPPGAYYVRLYTGSGELSREFGLQVE